MTSDIELLKMESKLASKVDLQMLDNKISGELAVIKTRITLALVLLAALSSGSHFLSTDMLVDAVAEPVEVSE